MDIDETPDHPELAIVCHGSWDRSSYFKVPPNVDIGFYYDPEGGDIGLCYPQSALPQLCQKRPSQWRRRNESCPNLILAPDAVTPSGIYDCKKSQFIDTLKITAQTTLEAQIGNISRISAKSGRYVTVRVLACGGGEKFKNLVSGRVETREEAVQRINRENATVIYQNAIPVVGEARAQILATAVGHGLNFNQAQRVLQLTDTGVDINQAMQQAFHGQGRKRKRTIRKKRSRKTKKRMQ